MKHEKSHLIKKREDKEKKGHVFHEHTKGKHPHGTHHISIKHEHSIYEKEKKGHKKNRSPLVK